MSSLDKASGSDPVLVVTQLSGHSRISDTKTDSLLIYNISLHIWLFSLELELGTLDKNIDINTII